MYSDVCICIKKPNDLVLKTEQRSLEDIWRWILDTHLNSTWSTEKVNTFLKFFLPSLTNCSDPAVMFKFLHVFTEWKRSSVNFFIRRGMFVSHFSPNALVLIYIYKKVLPHTWGILLIFFFVTSFCFKALAEALETCWNNLRSPKRKPEMSCYKLGLAVSESLQATIYALLWGKLVLAQVLLKIMLLHSSTTPWEKWEMVRPSWKWLKSFLNQRHGLWI